MIDILSLPRRHNINVVQVKNVVFKSGLPINSLPGWEHIPLNCKLPMLKCPGNQVIFSKNKIGHSFSHLKQEFDPCGRDSFPEYNPLHDSNLKTFYANERNLKRLRENGEITQKNDVICNLKDFNEYRQQLHKSQLYYILQELNRLEAEQRDRVLINNAETITTRDHRNLSARQHSYMEILSRKKRIDMNRANRMQKLWDINEERFQRIAGTSEMQRVLLENKKILNTMNMQHHWEVCKEEKRKQLIYLKKRFQIKKERLKKNLKILYEKRAEKAKNATILSWKKRLEERIENQRKMKLLLAEVANSRRIFIENHRQVYAEKWARIQEEIQKRSKSRSELTKKPKRKKKKKKKKQPLEKSPSDEHAKFSEYQEVFDKLISKDLCDALKIAVEMQGADEIPFDPDEPIYKAAKFILSNIIHTFDKDMSGDRITYDFVAERVRTFFDETKSFVTYRATQIIAHAREVAKKNEENSSTEVVNQRLSKCVSFSRFSATIGTSSYEIHPLIELKVVADRSPTPAGSLASIPVDNEQGDERQGKLIRTRSYAPHLTRNEMIFIEHFVIKFKHELIVGVGRRVFGAIQCHFENKIMDVRKEMLEIDKNFLVSQMTNSILSYARNSLNFDSCIKLCISALASDIVWSLQKHLLRPARDPRGIVRPRQCCEADANNIKLCLFCE